MQLREPATAHVSCRTAEVSNSGSFLASALTKILAAAA